MDQSSPGRVAAARENDKRVAGMFGAIDGAKTAPDNWTHAHRFNDGSVQVSPGQYPPSGPVPLPVSKQGQYIESTRTSEEKVSMKDLARTGIFQSSQSKQLDQYHRRGIPGYGMQLNGNRLPNPRSIAGAQEQASNEISQTPLTN